MRKDASKWKGHGFQERVKASLRLKATVKLKALWGVLKLSCDQSSALRAFSELICICIECRSFVALAKLARSDRRSMYDLQAYLKQRVHFSPPHPISAAASFSSFLQASV